MKTAIIGAGPAGVAAAVQLTRMGAECLVFEKNRIGGLINNAWRVENSVFLKDAVSGREIALTLEKQLDKWNIALHREGVTDAIYRPGMEKFILKTTEGIYESDFLIDATGTVPRKHVLIENSTVDSDKYCFL